MSSVAVTTSREEHDQHGRTHATDDAYASSRTDPTPEADESASGVTFHGENLPDPARNPAENASRGLPVTRVPTLTG